MFYVVMTIKARPPDVMPSSDFYKKYVGVTLESVESKLWGWIVGLESR